MRRLLMVTLALGALLACEDEEPCDRYVEYMCACHDGDEGFDCQELDNTLRGAESDVQDECAIWLTDQKDDDADAGLECDA